MICKLQLLAIVGIGGFIGSIARFCISTYGARILGSDFPYGTLIVNVVGAILMGFIMKLSLESITLSANIKLFLTTGIMGGLTTFSAFSYEAIKLLDSGNYLLASIHLVANIVLSLLGTLLGIYLAKLA